MFKQNINNPISRITAFIILLAGIVIITLFLMFFPAPSASNTNDSLLKSSVSINGVAISVDVAQTQAQREQGLSGRDGLKAGEGMLFVFDEADFLRFWMKDMNFPIDIVFINDQKIVDIVRDLPPPSKLEMPATYTSKQKANRVLEVPAGTAQALGWQVGDSVQTP